MTANNAIIANLILFFGVAFLCIHKKNVFKGLMTWIGRSKNAVLLFFGLAGIIVLYNISNLSSADFGQYKNEIFVIFFIGIVCAFWKCKDFLSVRGIAVLLLLLAKASLDSVFMEKLKLHNSFVTIQYALVIFATYLGVRPYIWRDFTENFLSSKVVRNLSRTIFLMLFLFMSVFYVMNFII